jgi:type I restriction enzyme, S subunit
MGYSTFDETMNTGVDWIREVPKHWRIKRLKFSTVLINQKVSAEESALPYIGLEHIESWTGKRITGEIANSEGLASRFSDGDVLFGKLRPYLAKVHLAKEDGLVSSEAFVVRSSTEVLPEFLKYYMLSPDFIEIVDSSTFGSKMPRANWEFVGNLPLLLPPPEEQQTIAAFLDYKTAKIDALIAKKKALLEKLAEKRTALISHAVTKGLDPGAPMRDSGIDWLGEIPAHWEVWKVTHGFNRIGSGTTPKTDNSDYYHGKIPWVTTSELRETFIKETTQMVTDEAVSTYSALKLYSKGSLAIAMYGATIGRLGILDVESTVNQACCVFSDPVVFDTRFVFYWLWMRRPILISLSNGGGQPNLSQDDLKKIWIPIPCIDEQKAIVEYLDMASSKIEQQEQAVNDAITRLQEYRSALITNAVTGKIDVRNFRLPEAEERVNHG